MPHKYLDPGQMSTEFVHRGDFGTLNPNLQSQIFDLGANIEQSNVPESRQLTLEIAYKASSEKREPIKKQHHRKSYSSFFDLASVF